MRIDPQNGSLETAREQPNGVQAEARADFN